jgi:hypothetical protein
VNKVIPSPVQVRVFLFLLSASILALQSCDKNETDPVDEYQYYPLGLGQYQIYQVEETTYSAGQSKPVVATWQEKDQVDRISSSDENTTAFIVARYRRNTSADYWQKFKEYTVTRSPDKVLTNIDNQTIFALIFPIDSRIKWNGNQYNNLDAEDFYYQDIHKPANIDNISFDKTLTVVERRDTSIINRYVGIKKYALGTGLISDEQTAYEYCQDEHCIGSETIESGTHKVKKIIEFGTLN